MTFRLLSNPLVASTAALRQSFSRTALTFQVRSKSFWAGVAEGPPDPILGVSVAYNADKDPRKLNLGVGAYRDDNGKPYVLDCVRAAEKRILESNTNMEYAGIVGIPEFVENSLKLGYGEKSSPLVEKRIVAAQAVSGTGALRLIGEFANRFHKQGGDVYMPNPTWGNHIPIMQDSGLVPKTYRYYNPATCGLDFEGLQADIKKAPEGSMFLFHASAHNPTGVDPTEAQWKALSEICRTKNHLCMFDMAYQGFASGDPSKDNSAIRAFVGDGHKIMLAQSFSKNFGLYGHRLGTMSIVTESAEEAKRVDSQLKILIRPMWSNPPIYGARIVNTIMADPLLEKQWRVEMAGMANQIIKMRKTLKGNLERLGSSRNWQHVTDQIGMFCYSGMTPEQVDRIKDEFHVYLTRNGRISMAGVTSKNVEYLAQAVHAVTK